MIIALKNTLMITFIDLIVIENKKYLNLMDFYKYYLKKEGVDLRK